MLKRKHKGNFTARAGAPLWMLTYGDLVTQILIFFVLLFSFSSIDNKKFDAAIISIQGALGIMPGGRTLERLNRMDYSPETRSSGMEAMDRAQLEAILQRIDSFVKAEGLQGAVVFQMQERGLVVRLADRVLFDLGKADLKPEAVGILDKLASVINSIPNNVRIEGHTDNLPISTERFPSNWELSTGRATNVVRYFVEKHGIPPRRLSAAGYGEYYPIASNVEEKGRQQNRRVDIVILRLSAAGNEPK